LAALFHLEQKKAFGRTSVRLIVSSSMFGDNRLSGALVERGHVAADLPDQIC
jgi:hypothetical protein